MPPSRISLLCGNFGFSSVNRNRIPATMSAMIIIIAVPMVLVIPNRHKFHRFKQETELSVRIVRLQHLLKRFSIVSKALRRVSDARLSAVC